MQLVGKAYINGIMTCEAFDKGKCQDMRIVQELPRILLEFLVFNQAAASLVNDPASCVCIYACCHPEHENTWSAAAVAEETIRRSPYDTAH